MKNVLLFLCLLFFSCSHELKYNEIITACGCEQPQENLSWLKELITKAENDKTGNCIGTIWLIKYKGKDIFVTDMALGSGGIANYFFDCSGNHLIWRNGESYCPSDYVGKNHFYVDDEKDFANFFHDVKLDVVIYSNTKL